MTYDDEDDAPLAGLSVIELTMYVQGPIAGLTLASLGADVIKIEQVDAPDFMRTFQGAFGVRFDEAGQEWFYSSLNRGKRSMVLDIASQSGRPIFERLIADADVFITNLRDDGLRRMGADAETLHAINPQLVYCRGGGFGLRGPMAADSCQDTVGMAYAGFMDITSSPDGTPSYPPGSMSDILTGTTMASAVLAGLVKRSTTGRGSVVGTSQTQALIWLQSQSIGTAANTGMRMARFDAHNPSNPLLSMHETADGWIAIAVLLPDQWVLMADGLGLGELLADERYATLGGVAAHIDEVTTILKDRFRTQTTQHWWDELRRRGLWVSPVNRIEELASDEQVLANEYLVTFPDGFVGPPAPFEVDDWRGGRRLTAAYGEHTDEILAELGYATDELIDLRAEGAIA